MVMLILEEMITWKLGKSNQNVNQQYVSTKKAQLCKSERQPLWDLIGLFLKLLCIHFRNS